MAEIDPIENSGNRFCGNCGSTVATAATICVHCGTSTPLETTVPEATVIELGGDFIPYCRACGVPVAREEALHCTKCGVTPLCREHFYPSTRSCSLCPPVESAESAEPEPVVVSGRPNGPWAQPAASIPCPRCGARIRQGVDYCPICGTEQEGAGRSQYAGFFVRLFAFVIDNLITGVPVTLITIFNDFPFLGTVVSIVYYVLFTYYRGQTPGKMLLGLHVENEDGNKPSLKQVLMREVVGKAISTLALLIGYLWILWDPKKRGWHDHIGGTYVVKRNRS
jgi:uncharacterized RDD family membrane protein YckC|tara:strand:- start:2472 stop:3311 length:840 start_codon:yes stop_codon:yes gene_type:complete